MWFFNIYISIFHSIHKLANRKRKTSLNHTKKDVKTSSFFLFCKPGFSTCSHPFWSCDKQWLPLISFASLEIHHTHTGECRCSLLLNKLFPIQMIVFSFLRIYSHIKHFSVLWLLFGIFQSCLVIHNRCALPSSSLNQ